MVDLVRIPRENNTAASITTSDDRILMPDGSERDLADMTKMRDEEFRDLLKGVPLSIVLSWAGMLFRNTDITRTRGVDGGYIIMGDESMYALSRVVTELDVFISHSWASPRWQKFLALAVWHRLHLALIASHLVGLLACCAMLAGWKPQGMFAPMPTRVDIWVDVNIVPSNEPPLQQTSVCTWLGLASFWIVLTCIPSKISGEEVCFLDKVCIHQSNKRRKAAGVQSLGGFVSNSRKMVVLWSEAYFSRLWCVFELASMLKTHKFDPKHIEFAPLSFGAFVALAGSVCMLRGRYYNICQYLGMIDTLVAADPPNPIVTWPIWLLTLMDVVVYYHLSFVRTMSVAAMRSQLECFSCVDADCFDPSDKPLVINCIRGWFGSTSAFDSFVRSDVAPGLLKEHGRLVPLFPGRILWTSLSFYTLLILDTISFNIDRPDLLWRCVLFNVLKNQVICMAFALAALPLYPIIWLARRGSPFIINWIAGAPLYIGFTILMVVGASSWSSTQSISVLVIANIIITTLMLFVSSGSSP